MNTRFLAFSFASLLTASAIAAPNDGVKLIESGDSQMQAAKATARRTLDQFLAVHSKPSFDAADFQVKVEFRHLGNVELMWVHPFRRIGDEFEGVLKNHPRNVPSLHHGQQVRFSRSQIADWGYFQRGKTYGHFTTCVLFDRRPDPESLKMKSDRGFICDSAGKVISPSNK